MLRTIEVCVFARFARGATHQVYSATWQMHSLAYELVIPCFSRSLHSDTWSPQIWALAGFAVGEGVDATLGTCRVDMM
eukprot:1960387-Amphidinium_carterae.2